MSDTVSCPADDSIFVCRLEMLPFDRTMSFPCTLPIITSLLSNESALVSPPFSVIVSLIMRPRRDGRPAGEAGSRTAVFPGSGRGGSRDLPAGGAGGAGRPRRPGGSRRHRGGGRCRRDHRKEGV